MGCACVVRHELDEKRGLVSIDVPRRERSLHLFFVWSLVFKGLFAVAEIAAGVAAFVVSQEVVLRIARRITADELSEDPGDLVANYLLGAARHFSGSAAHFIGVYLASHGAIKLALILALLLRKLWAYPLAIAVFGGFIVYQLYRYTVTHSASLMLLTIVDFVVIFLTWHEYRCLRARHRGGLAPVQKKRG